MILLVGGFEYLRHKHNMTLEEVGKHIGTTKQYVHQMEKRQQKISNKFKVKLAELYGISVEEFEKIIK